MIKKTVKNAKMTKKTTKTAQLTKKTTVTAELRKALKSLRIPVKNVFSDTRKPGGIKAVGVKVCRLKLSEAKKAKVMQLMENEGFVCHYIRYNNSQGYLAEYYNGTRFCFSHK
jgi:hypothetical protein